MTRSRYQPVGHVLVDGEWVMAYAHPDGSTVDRNGDPVGRSEYEGGPEYVRSVETEAGRFYESVDPDSGERVWTDVHGQAADPPRGEALTALVGPGRIVVVEGEVFRLYPAEDGTETWVDAEGQVVAPLAYGAEQGETIEVVDYAVSQGRRAVIGVDSDGDRCLYTLQGHPVDDVDWATVTRTSTPTYSGTPIVIGDYTFDGGDVHRVYLFENGMQAVRAPSGEWHPVIVPTDATYPEGPPFFEGAFEVGVDGSSANEVLQTFSFADGQTAYMVDGELMLVDTGLESTYPDGPPVHCGPYPGGELYVFPDGRQLLLRPDGTWAIADLPSIPPYDDLVAAEVDEPRDDVADASTTDELALGADADELADDDETAALGLVDLADDIAPRRAPQSELPQPSTGGDDADEVWPEAPTFTPEADHMVADVIDEQLLSRATDDGVYDVDVDQPGADVAVADEVDADDMGVDMGID